MKKTALEWFLTEFKKEVWFEPDSELDIWIKELIPKAKEMEKKQIVDTYVVGYGKGITHGAINAENYYNQTFNQ